MKRQRTIETFPADAAAGPAKAKRGRRTGASAATLAGDVWTVNVVNGKLIVDGVKVEALRDWSTMTLHVALDERGVAACMCAAVRAGAAVAADKWGPRSQRSREPHGPSGYRVHVLEGTLYVNGNKDEILIDDNSREVSIADDGDRFDLVNRAFAAGYEVGRDQGRPGEVSRAW